MSHEYIEYLTNIIHHLDIASTEMYDACNAVDPDDEDLYIYKHLFDNITDVIDQIIDQFRKDTGFDRR